MAETIPSDLSVALYAHSKCPEWGMAILAWEAGPRRAYQFEDGKLRTFRKGYYEMMKEVDAPADRAALILAELQRKLGDAVPRAGQAPVKSKRKPEMTFEEQIRVLRAQYPEGFADPQWLRKRRGKDAKRRTKGHRDAAVADAKETLAEDVMNAAIEAGQFSDVHAAAVKVLTATNLVSGAQLAPLADLPTGRHRSLALALRDLLYGEEAFALRFERFVAVLSLTSKRGPSWQLVTALPALVHPETEICVKPSSFDRQAAYMAPRLRLIPTPNGQLYRRLLEMATAVTTRLTDDGLAPADMLDVHDFIGETLKPSARKLLEH